MSNSSNLIDFSSVLASAVHDMKNSLCLLLQSIENLSSTLSEEHPEAAEQLATVHYEASRLNTGLMQLLSLYRAEKENLPVSIDEHYVEDVIDDVLATNQNYIANKKMTLLLEQEEDLAWYMDADLINVLLNDMLVNAMRYSKSKILVKAFNQDGTLHIQVEDDGPGYPESMLRVNTAVMQDFDISQGRTGLGLFFARMIAEAHTSGEQKGSIHLANGGRYGGSVFTLKLP